MFVLRSTSEWKQNIFNSWCHDGCVTAKLHFSFFSLLSQKDLCSLSPSPPPQKKITFDTLVQQKCDRITFYFIFDKEWMVFTVTKSALWLRNIHDDRCTDDELSVVRMTAFLFFKFTNLSFALPFFLAVIFFCCFTLHLVVITLLSPTLC